MTIGKRTKIYGSWAKHGFLVPSGSIYEYFTQNKPEKDEICYSWLPKHSFKQHRSFSTFSILSGPSDYLQKSADPRVISSNPFMKRSDLSEAIALWNYDSLKCVTESILTPYTNTGDYRMISIRNNNQIHFHNLSTWEARIESCIALK